MSHSDRDRRVARRERINELYRACWIPTPAEGQEGLPLTPDDHIFHMRGWLDLGHSPETLPAVAAMSERAEELSGREYAVLLAEEANDRPERWRRDTGGDA